MYEEESEDLKFYVNREWDEFVEEILNIEEYDIDNEELKYISDILDEIS